MEDKSYDRKPIRLLLVEDDPVDAELLRNQLRRRNVTVEVTVASLLKSALDRLSAEAFDIIVTDLGLPDSSGIEAFLRLRSGYPDLPIIVLTGLSDEDSAIEAVQKGAQDYLVKGQVDGALFIRAIRYAIERQKLLTQLERSLKEIRTLEGLIPICAWCKKIRDDQGYWKKVETYISEHTGAAFSHGICPECLKKTSPETFKKVSRERPELLGKEAEAGEGGQDKS